MKNEIETNEETPDFLVNFEPKNINEVLEFFEDAENCKSFLKNVDDGDSEYGLDSYDFVRNEKAKIEFCDYLVEIVDQEGGGEGGGEHWHSVFRVDKAGVTVGYFYIPGYYQSYNGTEIEYDDIYQVEPYEKPVTFWKALK